MAAAKLYRVILPVDDIALAQTFYTAVLAITGNLVSPGRCYFACGETILACYDPMADGDSVGAGWQFHANQYLYFSVPDLASTRAMAQAAGALAIGPIESMPWGETLFYAQDPFRNPICFVAHRTEFLGASP